MNEESRCTDLERQLCKAHSDSLMWKTKCDEQRLMSDEQIICERKRLRQKLDEATENTREKVTHLQSIEKTYEELKAELDDANHELSRSHAALHGLEKLQRTQDKALDHWGCQYRITTRELELLREENTALRMKLRRQAKDIDNLKDMIREHDIHFEFQASDVEAELRALRAEIEASLNTNGGYIPPITNGYALDKSSSVSTVRSSSSSSTVNSTFMLHHRTSSNSRYCRY